MQAARIGSTVLHYSDTGAQGGTGGATGGGTAGPALVFANSLGTDLRVWDALLPPRRSLVASGPTHASGARSLLPVASATRSLLPSDSACVSKVAELLRLASRKPSN